LHTGRNRLQQLEGLRIIAIVMIALSHMEFLYAGPVIYPYSAFYKLHLHNPDLGVDYFFMLSGFGLYLASMKADDSQITFGSSLRFAWQKIRKIYPFYLISMMLMIPFQLAIFQNGQIAPGGIKALLLKLPFVLTLTQTMTGIRYFSRALNSVCWFLSALAIIYIGAPLLISVLKKRVKTVKQAVVSLSVTYIGLLFFTWFLLLFDRNAIFGRMIFDDLFYSSPYIRVFYVAIGMEIGVLFSLISNRVKIDTRGELIAACIGFLYYWCKRLLPEDSISEIIWVRAIDVSVCALVLGVFCLGKGRLSASLSKIGRKSGYVVYFFLFHYPLRFYVEMVFTKLQINIGIMTGILETILIFGLSMLAAMICFRIRNRRSASSSPAIPKT
jgi:peptidoglycan/LPS O-acetylase OafA/YrhL